MKLQIVLVIAFFLPRWPHYCLAGPGKGGVFPQFPQDLRRNCIGAGGEQANGLRRFSLALFSSCLSLQGKFGLGFKV